MWNRDSPVSVVSLHWWPRRDWSTWPRLRWASSRTITWPSCRQCDNPTWSHTALLSRFHARCRSSFRLHNRRRRLLGGGRRSPIESLQFHCIHTMSHWSSGLPVCFPSCGTWVQSPGGYLCETRILLLVLSCYKVRDCVTNVSLLEPTNSPIRSPIGFDAIFLLLTGRLVLEVNFFFKLLYIEQIVTKDNVGLQRYSCTIKTFLLEHSSNPAACSQRKFEDQSLPR
jgi:hypothetical protein